MTASALSSVRVRNQRWIEMNLLKKGVLFFAPIPHPEEYSRILFIGPHPDDIEIGAGGTAAKLALMGKEVCFLVCTDGRYGTDFFPENTPEDQVIAIRRSEAILSAVTLRVSDVRFLELSDGGFYTDEELISGIAKVVADFKPDLIFAPDPNVSSECHVDHLRVGKAATFCTYFSNHSQIIARYGAESSEVSAIAYYFTSDPNRMVDIGETYSLRAKAIFDCHRSQFPLRSDAAKKTSLYLSLKSVYYGSLGFTRYAEPFRILERTHMHCFPEVAR